MPACCNVRRFHHAYAGFLVCIAQELKTALKKLQADFINAGQAQAEGKAKAQALRNVASLYQVAAEATREYEEAEVNLTKMKAAPTVEKRIGDVLIARNVKIGEVVSQWDKDGDGSVDQKEFCARVKELGVKAETWELDGLFAKLDESGDGSLDLKEMKSTLTGYAAHILLPHTTFAHLPLCACVHSLRESVALEAEAVQTHTAKVIQLCKVAKGAQKVHSTSLTMPHSLTHNVTFIAPTYLIDRE